MLLSRKCLKTKGLRRTLPSNVALFWKECGAILLWRHRRRRRRQRWQQRRRRSQSGCRDRKFFRKKKFKMSIALKRQRQKTWWYFGVRFSYLYRSTQFRRNVWGSARSEEVIILLHLQKIASCPFCATFFNAALFLFFTIFSLSLSLSLVLLNLSGTSLSSFFFVVLACH